VIQRGDCRDVLRRLTPGSVDLIATDPPYGISNKRNSNGVSKAYSGYTSDKGAWDTEVPAADWVPPAVVALRQGGVFCVTGTFGSLVPIYVELTRLGLRFQSHITWHKTNPAPSIHRRMLTHANEIILVYSKGGAWAFDYAYSKTLNGGKQCHNHWDIPAVRKVAGVTRKPPVLYERLIRLFSRPGETVLDPFAGSGVVIEAAEASGRKWLAIEIDPALCAHMEKLACAT